MDSSFAPGDGWKFASKIETDEALIVKAAQYPAEGQKIFWLCLDLAAARRAALPVKARMGAGVSPVLRRKTNELIFPGGQGIAGFSLKSRQERLIVPIDAEHHSVRQMWLDEGKAPRLLYLLVKQDVPSSERRARYAAGEKQSFEVNSTYSLCVSELNSTPSRSLIVFDSVPVALDVDWERMTASALLQNNEKPRERKLVEISLSSGKMSFVRATAAMTLAVSPRHTMLTWDHYDPKIIETHLDGRETVLSEVGWYPSFSPDGSRFAFTVGDYEIWIQDAAKGGAEKVVSIPKEISSSQHYHDKIVWCPCGRHFAVTLVRPKPKQHETNTLMVVDCDRREVMVVEDAASFTIPGERIWVPVTVVKDYFDKSVV